MTVSELISILSDLPPSMPVMVDGYEGGLFDLTKSKVFKTKVARNANGPMAVYGPHAKQTRWLYECHCGGDCDVSAPPGACPGFDTDALLLSRHEEE